MDSTKAPENPFVAPSSSPQARDQRQATDERDRAKQAEDDKPKATPKAKAADADDGDKATPRNKQAREAAKIEKADKEAQGGKRPSAWGNSQIGGDQGHVATKTYAHRACGTELEVPADQSGPAESKCMGCRQDVDPSDWVLRDQPLGGVVV